MSDIATLVPEPADTELAASALRGLDAVLGTQGPVRLHLAGQVGEVEVPPFCAGRAGAGARQLRAR